MSERKTVDEIIEDEKVWSSGSVVLYHVTPEYNVESIMRDGVRPELARGKMSASWYVTKHGIVWALAHTSLRHDIPVSNLVVMTTMLPMSAMKKTGIRNAYCTKFPFTPEYWTAGEYFIYRELITHEQ
jgi:hypothetical protein